MGRPIANSNALARAALSRPAGRYVFTGATVAATYVVLTLLLSAVFGLPLPVTTAIGYTVAVTLHFTLQRRFVFGHVERFALDTRHQIARYVVVGVIQYVITTIATEVLAPKLGVSPAFAFLCVVGITSTVGFLLLRHGVFHPRPAEAGGGLD